MNPEWATGPSIIHSNHIEFKQNIDKVFNTARTLCKLYFQWMLLNLNPIKVLIKGN